MVRVLTKADLEVIERKGGSVERIPKPAPETVQVSGLEAIVEHFHKMKREQAENYKAAMDAKLRKMDEMIAAIGKPTAVPGLDNLVKIMTELKQLQVEQEKKEDDDGHAPCEYHLTFERDQRNLIDGTKGIRFAPVKADG